MKKNAVSEETHCGACSSRPDLYGIIIPGKHGRLLATLYTAAGEGPHPSVILLHGIPGCEQNLDLAQVLRRTGFHVMTFHYSGSWGSGGTYSLQHDIDDAETVLDFMLRDETYGFDKARIYAAGHSLGGFVCGQLTARRSEIRAAVLLMPCNAGRVRSIAAENPANERLLCEVFDDSVNWLAGLTKGCLYREALEHEADYALENHAAILAKKPLLCITGSLDPYTPLAHHAGPLLDAIRALGGTQVKAREYPTDHFFSDYRLQVSEDVTEFLLSLPF